MSVLRFGVDAITDCAALVIAMSGVTAETEVAYAISALHPVTGEAMTRDDAMRELLRRGGHSGTVIDLVIARAHAFMIENAEAFAGAYPHADLAGGVDIDLGDLARALEGATSDLRRLMTRVERIAPILVYNLGEAPGVEAALFAHDVVLAALTARIRRVSPWT